MYVHMTFMAKYCGWWHSSFRLRLFRNYHERCQGLDVLLFSTVGCPLCTSSRQYTLLGTHFHCRLWHVAFIFARPGHSFHCQVWLMADGALTHTHTANTGYHVACMLQARLPFHGCDCRVCACCTALRMRSFWSRLCLALA